MALHGGKRKGAGRKSKAEELVLIEKLKPLDDAAFKALTKGIKTGDFMFIKLFMEYRYGKPKETVKHEGEIKTKLKIGYAKRDAD